MKEQNKQRALYFMPSAQASGWFESYQPGQVLVSSAFTFGSDFREKGARKDFNALTKIMARSIPVKYKNGTLAAIFVDLHEAATSGNSLDAANVALAAWQEL